MGDPATAAAGTDDILGNSTKRTLEKYDLVSVPITQHQELRSPWPKISIKLINRLLQ